MTDNDRTTSILKQLDDLGPWGDFATIQELAQQLPRNYDRGFIEGMLAMREAATMARAEATGDGSDPGREAASGGLSRPVPQS